MSDIPSRKDYQKSLDEKKKQVLNDEMTHDYRASNSQADHYHQDGELTTGQTRSQTDQAPPRRAKYNARVDKFLNNGILIVGFLLIVVLLIAFLV